MKKYLVAQYYSWEGDFGLITSEVYDTESQAKQKQFELIQAEVEAWMRDGVKVLIGAEEMSNEVLDNLPSGTIIVENFGDSIIASEYGRSSINHEEILIKEIEI